MHYTLIQAWFRELPEGVLDSLSPEQVLHCNTEEQCIELVELLPPTQAALLHWVVELMADVVEEEESNKMNARNVAMVFAPNMTQVLPSNRSTLFVDINANKRAEIFLQSDVRSTDCSDACCSSHELAQDLDSQNTSGT